MMAGMILPPPLRPIANVSEAQANELAKRIVDVGNLYDLGTVFNPKTAAWVALITTAGAIYAPNVGTVVSGIAAQMREQRKNKGPLNVSEFVAQSTPQAPPAPSGSMDFSKVI